MTASKPDPAGASAKIVAYVADLSCGILILATPLEFAYPLPENCIVISRWPESNGYVGSAYPSPLRTLSTTLAFGIGTPAGSSTVIC